MKIFCDPWEICRPVESKGLSMSVAMTSYLFFSKLAFANSSAFLFSASVLFHS
ncbi:hypothetical protein BDR03DRAFT_957574 [Suillus americanus]|nr:hypothetical protein BDR03DRAFT_957574 [Suillus americanus]